MTQVSLWVRLWYDLEILPRREQLAWLLSYQQAEYCSLVIVRMVKLKVYLGKTLGFAVTFDCGGVYDFEKI